MSQIGTVQVPCYVLQYNNTIIIDNNQIIGRTLQVPCRNEFQDDPNYWFVPVKDSGILSTFTPVPKVFPYDDTHPPTFDSISVFRVRDKISATTWWIYGTLNDFVTSCSTCCGVAAIPMPVPATPLRFAPCDTLCVTNADGNYIFVTALPTLKGAQKYYPFGAYNNAALPAASGSGYTLPSDLLTFLNASWKNIGSPNANLVWTLSPDNLTLTATGGFLGDTLCVSIGTVGASS